MDIVKEMDHAAECCDSAVHYLKWQVDMMLPYAGKSLLEVGAGRGRMTAHFIEGRDRYVTAEISDDRARALNNSFRQYPYFQASCIDICNPALFESLPRESFDTIICSNVLEHIEDHETALKNMFSCLQESGHLLLLVPAFKFLYSEFDGRIGHFRRYRKKEVSELAERSGFQTVRCTYFNFIGILGWYYNFKLLKRVFSADRSENRSMLKQGMLYDKYVVPACRMFETIITVPAGLSVFYTGRKT